MTQLLADPVAWFIAGSYPLAVLLLRRLGASWGQAFAYTAIVCAVSIGAGVGLSLSL